MAQEVQDGDHFFFFLENVIWPLWTYRTPTIMPHSEVLHQFMKENLVYILNNLLVSVPGSTPWAIFSTQDLHKDHGRGHGVFFPQTEKPHCAISR